MTEPGKELAVSAAGLEEVPVPHPDGRPVPDWVIVGMPTADGGVRLFASLTLTSAQLTQEPAGFDKVPVTANSGGPVARIPRYVTTVTAQMDNFTQILGEDYPSALRSLMEMWARARPQP